MANTARWVATALAVSATLLTASLASAADTDRRTIVLHVDDYAGLSPTDLAEAEREVSRIYGAAGVRTIWAGRAGADDAGEALHVKVLILSEEMGERKIAAENVAAGVLGRAAKATGRAYVFSHRITRVAGGHRQRVGSVLGRVIAHEVGHLVLGEHSHSKTGIMCATLDMRPSTARGFTSAQVAAIHSVLAGN
jgi:hypothetical protein